MTLCDWRPPRPVLSEPVSFQHIDLERATASDEQQVLQDHRRAASVHRVQWTSKQI